MMPPFEEKIFRLRRNMPWNGGEEIPTSGKRDPDWGEDIPTPGNYPSDPGQEIPISGYLLPVLRQVFQNKINFGLLFGLFLRFVQRLFVCPHKLEKNLSFFLESAENRHIFALAKTGCASAI